MTTPSLSLIYPDLAAATISNYWDRIREDSKENDNIDKIDSFAVGVKSFMSAALASSSFVDVKSFGAVGDGSTDDVNAIQTAIDFASSSGSIVIFPAGRYKVTRPIELPSNSTVMGVGRKSVITVGTNSISLMTSSNHTEISVRDLCFEGNNTSATGVQYGNGLYFVGCSDVRIESCRFKNFGNPENSGGCAIFFYDGNSKINITDNYITGGAGKTNSADIVVYANSADVLIRGNRCICDATLSQSLRNSSGIMTSIVGVSSSRVIVTDNFVAGHTRHGIIPAYGGEGQRDTIIANNICIDCDDVGIYVNCSSSNGWIVNGNIVDSCSGGGLNGVGIDGGIVLLGKGRKVCTNNFVFNTGYKSNGTLRDGFIDWSVTGSTGIRIGGLDESIVSNNFIEKSAGAGITVYEFSEANATVSLRDNAIFDTTTYGVLINCSSFVKRMDVTGNRIECKSDAFDSHGLYIIYMMGDSDAVNLRDNSVYGRKLGSNKIGMCFQQTKLTGSVENNTIRNYDTAVSFQTLQDSVQIGKNLMFNNNFIKDSTVGLAYYLSEADKYGFGIGNRFSGNGTDKQPILGFSNYRDALSIVPSKVFYDAVSPPSGTWSVGDTVYHSTPSAGGYVGWVCVASGSPGTWKTFGVITS